MDGFSYNNIFETKGTEYLIIIAFLILIIPFWILINREVPVKVQIKKMLGILSESILKIPQGLLFGKNHTWTYLTRTGLAEVGIDDFLFHITGDVSFNNLKEAGTFIRKGDLLADLTRDGRNLKVYSPVSGTIMAANSDLSRSPQLASDDPYGRGWIYRIKPLKWKEETGTCIMAEEAVEWSRRELSRFRDFLAGTVSKYSPEYSMVLLQDGGELYDKPLAGLPDAVWNDFQKSFLDPAD